MPLTALDSVTALVVIDLQKGMTAYPVIHPFAEIVSRTRTLVAAFRAAQLPIAFVNVAGGAPGRTERGSRNARNVAADWTDLLPELDPQPHDIFVTKRSWGAFATTDLQRRLEAASVTQVVLTGVATSVGVESTGRQAYEAGFNVTFALDAVTDVERDAHERSVAAIFPRIGETGTSAEIVALLERGANVA